MPPDEQNPVHVTEPHGTVTGCRDWQNAHGSFVGAGVGGGVGDGVVGAGVGASVGDNVGIDVGKGVGEGVGKAHVRTARSIILPGSTTHEHSSQRHAVPLLKHG